MSDQSGCSFALSKAGCALLSICTWLVPNKERLDERGVTGVTPWLQPLNQQRKWIFLMVKCLYDGLTYLSQEFLKRRIAREVCAQNDRIGKIADDSFLVCSVSAKRWGSYQQIFLLSIAEQQHLECRQHEGVERYLLCMCQRSEPL